MSAWKRLPAVQGSDAYLTCGAGARSDLDPGRFILVGFGDAGYSRDGITLWSESGPDQDTSGNEWPIVATVEALASEDPDHDWRIYFFAPMYEAEYQRHGPGVWALVRKGEGFA